MFLRSTALAAGLAAVLAAPALAATGPYAGTVRQGETDTHDFDNNPKNVNCIQLAQPYRVTLTYVPASDTLTLTAAEYTATGSNGRAEVAFEKGVCAAFDISVTGTAVADEATYALTVRAGVLAAGLGELVSLG